MLMLILGTFWLVKKKAAIINLFSELGYRPPATPRFFNFYLSKFWLVKKEAARLHPCFLIFYL